MGQGPRGIKSLNRAIQQFVTFVAGAIQQFGNKAPKGNHEGDTVNVLARHVTMKMVLQGV